MLLLKNFHARQRSHQTLVVSRLQNSDQGEWPFLEQQLELWGGVECSINRVRSNYFEQLRRTGHLTRTSDFARFAGLGIKALRQPILWECTPSHGSEAEQWEWASIALAELSRLEIRPIVGLVHHGSGPTFTSLLDPAFPNKLAEYAEQVAYRFPDVRDYTPVNEPLTTARFSALYGHWYPHCRDEHSFARALLNQCRGVVLAMKAIRRVNPAARLIQTEDLGKVHSTPALLYQAGFENERRWSTFDLLCGRIDHRHRMWHHFLWSGIAEHELEWFLENPCPPDVIGLNHYLSSERYLDEHLERYPAETHGGNGKHRYADVLAARVLQNRTTSDALFLECWARYEIPIAVTECHNGCTREEQLRWFLEVWRGAQKARIAGAKLVAVTAWALLGSFDWDSLVTEKNDRYEPGIFDIRSAPPRPTALAPLILDLVAAKDVCTPLLDVPGWWGRRRRFEYGISIDDVGHCSPVPNGSINADYRHVQPVLITDTNTDLGREFARLCELRGIPYRALDSRVFKARDPSALRKAFRQFNPWAVINTLGEKGFENPHPQSAFRGRDTFTARQLARECQKGRLKLLEFSSDLVFDGKKGGPYVESDTLTPLDFYGANDAEVETLIQQEMPSALILRTGPLFGSSNASSFIVRALRSLRSKQPFSAANDAFVSPTYIPDLVDACLDLLIDGEQGIWHLVNPGNVSWADFAKMAAKLADVPSSTLRACSARELETQTMAPGYRVLTSERGILLPALEDALARFLRDRVAKWQIQEPDPESLAA